MPPNIQRQRQIGPLLMVLVLLLTSVCAAKLPPRVEAIYPKSKKSFRADSEIWLYGPTLGSLDHEGVSLVEGSSGALVELKIEELSCSDFSNYAFDVDWSDGRVGDHGELELLVVRPLATLDVDGRYELETEFLRRTYRIASAAETAPPLPKLQVHSAVAHSSGGRTFDGDPVRKLEIAFSPVASVPGTALRVEVADAASEQPYAFAILANQQARMVTLAGPAQIKVRLVDGLGRTGEWSAPSTVSRAGLSWKVALAVIAIVLLILGAQRFRK